MTPNLQWPVLQTDFDANQFTFLNVSKLDPVPDGIVGSDDPRLDDLRMPLAGSVTNDSVADDAAIAQSKLDLNGNIPTSWLGSTSTTAARGDLAEYIANKGAANGYAPLDGGSKIPAINLPTDVGTGTVTSVGITMPTGFTVTGSPVTGSGVIAVEWTDEADESWFGNMEGAPAPPRFYTDPFPVGLIPDLDTSQVTSGTFDPDRLPIMVGLGIGHAPGAVPDPGDGSGGADATDYLARDGSWKAIPTMGPAYQPTIPDPVLSPSANPTGDKTVMISSTIDNVTFFYSLTSDAADFQEFPSGHYISLAPSDQMWAYAAKPGYINSDIVDYTNPNP